MMQLKSYPLTKLRTRGLYFLYSGDEIVYIGMSVCIENRIDHHCLDTTKNFDSAAYWECPKGMTDCELAEEEANQILKHLPYYNRDAACKKAKWDIIKSELKEYCLDKPEWAVKGKLKGLMSKYGFTSNDLWGKPQMQKILGNGR